MNKEAAIQLLLFHIQDATDRLIFHEELDEKIIKIIESAFPEAKKLDFISKNKQLDIGLEDPNGEKFWRHITFESLFEFLENNENDSTTD